MSEAVFKSESLILLVLYIVLFFNLFSDKFFHLTRIVEL